MYKKGGLAIIITSLLVAVVTAALALLASMNCADRVAYGNMDNKTKSRILVLGQTIMKVSLMNDSNLGNYLIMLNMSLSTYHNVQIKGYGFELYRGKEYFYLILNVNGTKLLYVSEVVDK